MIFWQVDAFTDEIFQGNPAAVFILEHEPAKILMQNIAREMNLSETAFVIRSPEPKIRWFTPNAEVDLCGHATLSAAHILWSEGFFKGEEIEFQSRRSGRLGVRKVNQGYMLDFPVQAATEKSGYTKRTEELLGFSPVYVGSNDHDCMVVVEKEEQVHAFSPDYSKIKALPERGFVVTAQSNTHKDTYIYRAFFPKLDVPEDPVTGSANTCLAPYWCERLNTSKLHARQVSERGGRLRVELSGDRVFITGQAVTVFAGKMRIAE